MKKILTTVLMILSLDFIVAGEKEVVTETHMSDYTVTTTLSVWDKYAVDGTLYADTPVFQQDLLVEHENGIWFDLWGSVGLEGGFLFDDEFDLGVGWDGSVCENYNLFIGGWYYWFEDSEGGDALFGKIELSRDFEIDNLTVSPFVGYHHYHAFGIVSGGNIFQTGVSLSHKLSDSWSIYLKSYAMYDDGYFGLDPGWRVCAEAGLEYQISERTTLSFDTRLMTPIQGLDDYDDESIIGVSLVHVFGK